MLLNEAQYSRRTIGAQQTELAALGCILRCAAGWPHPSYALTVRSSVSSCFPTDVATRNSPRKTSISSCKFCQLAAVTLELRQTQEDFFTTKEVCKGTGQGLAIARSVVVDKHGGTIEVESEVGHGTTFCIRLRLGT